MFGGSPGLADSATPFSSFVLFSFGFCRNEDEALWSLERLSKGVGRIGVQSDFMGFWEKLCELGSKELARIDHISVGCNVSIPGCWVDWGRCVTVGKLADAKQQRFVVTGEGALSISGTSSSCLKGDIEVASGRRKCGWHQRVRRQDNWLPSANSWSFCWKSVLMPTRWQLGCYFTPCGERLSMWRGRAVLLLVIEMWKENYDWREDGWSSMCAHRYAEGGEN